MTEVLHRGKEQLSFPAGGVRSNHAKRDTVSGFQLAGIQKNGCPTKVRSVSQNEISTRFIESSRTFGHNNFILLGAVSVVRNIS
ncbi:MAG: hypothetical protein ABSA44_01640 [Bacteroidota bacterium]